ncbi:hypothetical protein PFISCL1PPCAC_21737, partial [Pristionchus fissidentatus]
MQWAEEKHATLLSESCLSIGVFVFYSVLVGQLTALAYQWPREATGVMGGVSGVLIICLFCIWICPEPRRVIKDDEVEELENS